MKYRKPYVLILFFFLINPYLVFSQTKEDTKVINVGVIPFEYPQRIPVYKWLGDYLTDSLSGFLNRLPNVRVVERKYLDNVLKEIEFSLSDLADLSSSGSTDKGNEIKLGAFGVARYLIAGSYAVQNKVIKINLRSIDVETGTAKGACSVEGRVDDLFKFEEELDKKTALLISQPVPFMKTQNSISLESHKVIKRTLEMWNSLPFHERDPRYRRNRQKYEQILDMLENFIMENPFYAPAYYYAGEFYLQLKDYDTASDYFKALLNEKMDYSLGYLGFGDLYRFEYKENKALDNYKKSLKYDPNNAGTYYGMAKSLLRLNQPLEAFDKLLKVIEVKPELQEAEGLVNMIIDSYSQNVVLHSTQKSKDAYTVMKGIIELRKNNRYKASLFMQSVKNIFPKLYFIPYSKALLCLDSSELRCAEAKLKETITLYPTFPDAHLHLGNVLLEEKNMLLLFVIIKLIWLSQLKVLTLQMSGKK